MREVIRIVWSATAIGLGALAGIYFGEWLR